MLAAAAFHASIRRALRGAFLLLALGPACLAADDDDPPPVGQPDYFNGAVGKFRITTSADPIQVQAEDPLTYTVRVVAEEMSRPPKRPVLADFPNFKEGFYIEDIAPAEGNHPDEKTWEFVYRLKPKNTSVNAIPGFLFVFYSPGSGYQTKFAPELDITVVARKQVPTVTKPIGGPETAFVLADGDALRRDDARLPELWVLVLMLLAPPIGCIALYLVWRRLYPDDARRAHRRRSRAAQEALRLLHDVQKQTDSEQQALCAAAVIARYLQQRLDWEVIEPTPAEVESYLPAQGISEKLAGQTADLLRTCAAVRFDPDRPSHAELAAATSDVILALEAETWSE